MGDIDPLASAEGEEEGLDIPEKMRGVAVIHDGEGWSVQALGEVEALTNNELMAFAWDYVGGMVLQTVAALSDEEQ